MGVSPEAARWMLERRGITEDTLWSFHIVSAPGKADFVYTYPGGAQKFRKGFDKVKDDPESRRIWWEPATATGQVPFLPPDFAPESSMFLVEGESDTMAFWQNAGDDERAAVVGLSGLNAWKDEYAESLFGGARRVFVLLDNDDPYDNAPAAKQNADAWVKIRAALGRKARRVQLPQGTKDVAEFFMQYDWAAMTRLLRRAAQPVTHYPRLDLTQDPPPTDWLLEGLLVRGEVAVLSGDAGIGKSWLSMALSVAIVQKQSRFLGLPLKAHGPVLYVDEENSAELVMQRLHALGLDAADSAGIDYISQAGVHLDTEPEKLLEEALDREPVLIVLDSHSTVSPTTPENDNDEMTKFWLNAVKPLARLTGAAVLVLHHTPHDDHGRPRGASAIKAAADQVIGMGRAKVKGVETGNINLFKVKARRMMEPLTYHLEGDAEAGETVTLSAGEEEPSY